MTEEYGDSTRCVHAGLPEPGPGQPFLAGPVFASTYHLGAGGPAKGVDGYGRPDNATRRGLEAAIGSLEGGECVLFASGMAAVSAVLLGLAPAGRGVLVPADGYYQVREFASETLPGYGIPVVTAPTNGPYPSFVDIGLAVLESPSNPGLEVCDIEALAASLHAAGALVAVDNTTATPLGQRPLDLGADVVVASGTKALAGHSDLLLGYLCTRRPEIVERMRHWRDLTGGIPGPFDCWLAHRSLATLDLRLARQSENAAALAALLSDHPAVRVVRWPGRPGDPGYEVARRQMRRVPGVLMFELADRPAVERFLAGSRLVRAATSFGGLHTTADRRAQWGDAAPDGLVRLSCGIEDTADLVADLRRALGAVGYPAMGDQPA